MNSRDQFVRFASTWTSRLIDRGPRELLAFLVDAEMNMPVNLAAIQPLQHVTEVLGARSRGRVFEGIVDVLGPARLLRGVEQVAQGLRIVRNAPHQPTAETELARRRGSSPARPRRTWTAQRPTRS